MTPHEVIKDSLEKFIKKAEDFEDRDLAMGCWECGKEINVDGCVKYLKSSQLSLLLSVKEMVGQYKNYYNPVGDERNKGKHDAMSDLQSLLDEEINKVKEI